MNIFTHPTDNKTQTSSRNRGSGKLASQKQHPHIGQILNRTAIQPKLTIGAPNDKYEQEADRVADQVMRMPDPSVQRQTDIEAGQQTSLIQTKPLAEQITPLNTATTQRLCTECEDELQRKPIDNTIQRDLNPNELDDDIIQAKSTTTPDVTPNINAGIQSLQGGGRPLSNSERNFFEPRFGTDFSNVRLHTDAPAANLAHSINARAFTHGNNITLGPEENSLTSSSGKALLAHELTHVVQQLKSVKRSSMPQNVRIPKTIQRTKPSSIVMRQEETLTGSPASTSSSSVLSVNRREYLRLVRDGITNISGRLVGNNTLSETIRPILLQMLDHVIFRDSQGNDSEGQYIQYQLQGTPSVTLSLSLILDNSQNDSTPAGRFSFTNNTTAQLIIFVRKNSSLSDITETIYHESMHMLFWIVNRYGAARFTTNNPRAIRALEIYRYQPAIDVLNIWVGSLANNVNQRRQTNGQTIISPAQITNVSRFLVEEIIVRAQTEIFRQTFSVQTQPRRPLVLMPLGPHGDISARMLDRYVFIFSNVFSLVDKNNLTSEDRDILNTLLDILRRLYEVTLRRQFSLTLITYGQNTPRQTIPWQQPPLTPPRRSRIPPLPVP